jgi:hypothetical protein
LPDILRAAGEIQHAVTRGPAGGLPLPRLIAFHQDFELGADQRLIAADLDLALKFLEYRQPPSLFFFWDCVDGFGSGSVRPWGVFE